MICLTCNERPADKGHTCPECRLKKRRASAKEYKTRMRDIAKQAKQAARVEEPEREAEPEEDPAVDMEQFTRNLQVDAATGERMRMAITSGVGRRYARGAEWLMGG